MAKGGGFFRAVEHRDACNKLHLPWFKSLYEVDEVQKITIGIDEVGNGALFGPIAVAGVVNLTGWRLDGVKDSKAVRSEVKRKALANEIRHNTIWCVAMVQASKMHLAGGAGPTLEKLNRHVADTLYARLKANHPDAAIEVVYDGDPKSKDDPAPYSIVHMPKADALVYEVSAASLLAKVAVDDWIHNHVKANQSLTRYGLDANKGYGTDGHRAAIREFGMTPEHRVGACSTTLKGNGNGTRRTSSAGQRV